MRSKRKDPVDKAFDKLVDMFGLIGTSILFAATFFRVIFALALAIRPVLILDLIITLLMAVFYLLRRLLR